MEKTVGEKGGGGGGRGGGGFDAKWRRKNMWRGARRGEAESERLRKGQRRETEYWNVHLTILNTIFVIKY